MRLTSLVGVLVPNKNELNEILLRVKDDSRTWGAGGGVGVSSRVTEKHKQLVYLFCCLFVFFIASGVLLPEVQRKETKKIIMLTKPSMLMAKDVQCENRRRK